MKTGILVSVLLYGYCLHDLITDLAGGPSGRSNRRKLINVHETIFSILHLQVCFLVQTDSAEEKNENHDTDNQDAERDNTSFLETSSYKK